MTIPLSASNQWLPALAEGWDHPKVLQQTQPICVFPLLHNLVAVEPVEGAPGLVHLLAYRRKPRDRSIPRTLTALRPKVMRASTAAQLARSWDAAFGSSAVPKAYPRASGSVDTW